MSACCHLPVFCICLPLTSLPAHSCLTMSWLPVTFCLSLSSLHVNSSACCLQCKETETMERFLSGHDNYSAKLWRLAGRLLTLVILSHFGDHVPNIYLSPLEFIHNKLHSSILIHIKDGTMQRVLSCIYKKWNMISSFTMFAKKKTRTTTIHSSSFAFSDQQDLCPAWRSGCPPGQWCISPPTACDTNSTPWFIIFIHLNSSDLTPQTFSPYILPIYWYNSYFIVLWPSAKINK